jgi:hypothetical protein
MQDEYVTPEGFRLYRPLLLPDARRFDEVLTAEKAWDFATMNHRNGHAQPETPAVLRREHPNLRDWKIIDRFCSVEAPGRHHLQVTPTQQVVDLIWAEETESLTFAFFERVGFKAIYHERNDRVLILASASNVSNSRYLAYVSLGSVPTMAVA